MHSLDTNKLPYWCFDVLHLPVSLSKKTLFTNEVKILKNINTLVSALEQIPFMQGSDEGKKKALSRIWT